jgi:peptidyl-prolyl cis-trans isomerase C
VEVVARVDGQPVYWDDLEFEVLAQQAAAGVLYEGPAGEARLADLQEAVLQRLVDRLLLVAEAKRRGYSASPEEVREERDKLLGRVPQRTEISRRLASGRYRDQLDRFAEWSVLAGKLVAKVRSGVRVTPEDVEAYYRRHRDRLFRQPPSVLADEVVLPTREKAEEVRGMLEAGLAAEEAASRLGVQARRTILSPGLTDPARTEAVWNLPKGSVSRVVETPEGGYAVLRVVERTPERVLTLEQARPTVERVLRVSQENRLLGELMTRLRAEAKVERLWNPKAGPSPSPSPGAGR